MTSSSAARPSPAALVRDYLLLGGALALVCQWMVVRALPLPLPGLWDTLLPGLAIFGAAALLSWGAELAQLEISQTLAIAFLALVAVLPEYAVDMLLAWKAGKEPHYIALAAANMTGSNRLLIGMGWPAVLLAYWLVTRKQAIAVAHGQRLELFTLLVATLYAFLIPFKGTFSIVDTVCLLALFAWYIRRASQVEHAEHGGLAGPPERLALLPRTWRQLVTVGLFVVPAVGIFLAAEPFAEGLLHHARAFGVEEFILIQWLAPLASESPEFVVAIVFALRGNATAGLGTLISSKVNQWTLLVGMLPLVYSISGGHLQPMPLDARQIEEVFLTAAQSVMALVVLANMSFGWGEAALLFLLFILQFFFPTPEVRLWLGALYLGVAALYLCRRQGRQALGALLRSGWASRPGH
jgi:cation:H+ antiporter